jgi:hypothetical protein
MNKRLLIGKIIAQLGENLETLYAAARSSRTEATHESSKAENKYDTRGLEAGYLAQGQMKQAEQIEQSITEFQKMPCSHFEPETPIANGAVIELDSKEGNRFYFMAARGGGIEVEMDGKEIIVLTPQAPLGQLLMGKKLGDSIKFGEPKPTSFRIKSIQ